MTKVAVLGMGRMGKEIISLAVKEGLDVVAAVDSDSNAALGGDAGAMAGIEPIGVKVTSVRDLGKTLDQTKPDVVIDFSNAGACYKNYKTVCGKKTNMVIGTTGFSAEQIASMKLEAEKEGIGVVLSPNMSVGVNVFWELIKEAAEKLAGYDIEIIEKHHRFKKDAPSGTALKTAEVISEVLDKNLSDDEMVTLTVSHQYIINPDLLVYADHPPNTKASVAVPFLILINVIFLFSSPNHSNLIQIASFGIIFLIRSALNLSGYRNFRLKFNSFGSNTEIFAQIYFKKNSESSAP